MKKIILSFIGVCFLLISSVASAQIPDDKMISEINKSFKNKPVVICLVMPDDNQKACDIAKFLKADKKSIKFWFDGMENSVPWEYLISIDSAN